MDGNSTISGLTGSISTDTVKITVGTSWKYCPECGKQLESGWKHCPGCGQAIGQTVSTMPWYPIYPTYPSYPYVTPTILPCGPNWPTGTIITCGSTGPATPPGFNS